MKDPRHAKSTYRFLLPFLRVVDERGGDVTFDSFMARSYDPIRIEKLGWGVPTFGGIAYRITQVTPGNLPEAIFSVRHDSRTIIPVVLRRDENVLDNSRYAYDVERSVFWSTWNGVNLDQLTKQDEFLWTWAKSLELKRGIFPFQIVS